jgi:hypothetical protein
VRLPGVLLDGIEGSSPQPPFSSAYRHENAFSSAYRHENGFSSGYRYENQRMPLSLDMHSASCLRRTVGRRSPLEDERG